MQLVDVRSWFDYVQGDGIRCFDARTGGEYVLEPLPTLVFDEPVPQLSELIRERWVPERWKRSMVLDRSAERAPGLLMLCVERTRRALLHPDPEHET